MLLVYRPRVPNPAICFRSAGVSDSWSYRANIAMRWSLAADSSPHAHCSNKYSPSALLLLGHSAVAAAAAAARLTSGLCRWPPGMANFAVEGSGADSKNMKASSKGNGEPSCRYIWYHYLCSHASLYTYLSYRSLRAYRSLCT